MLPCKGPAAVSEHIAYFIVGDSVAVEACQQVAPIAATVGIGLGGKGSTQCTGGVGVLCAAQDIARSVICPCPGLVEFLVVFPDQLVLTVICVGNGVCSVADRGDVAVAVVGIGEVEIALQGGDKRTVPLSPNLSTHRTVPCATRKTHRTVPCAILGTKGSLLG